VRAREKAGLGANADTEATAARKAMTFIFELGWIFLQMDL
jgi:hypothetical protein